VRKYQFVFQPAPGAAAAASGAFSAFVRSFKLTGAKVKSNLSAEVELKLTTALRFGAAPLPPGFGGLAGNAWGAVAYAGPLSR
jgi:hypothetical protein